MGVFKDIIQLIYVHLLRLFEHLLGPRTCGVFDKTKKTWSNFSREMQWGLNDQNYYEPRSVSEIVEIVKRAREKGLGVRAIGSGHSFNNITEPALGSYVINLAPHFNKVVRIDKLATPERDNIPDSLPVVAYGTVQGGMKLKDLTYQLSKLGYGVHNMGNYYQQTVAGVISTGTHGTTGRLRADTFTSIVVRLQIVNGRGEVEYLEGGADSITLGALGVITEATLRLVPMYWLEHQTTQIPDIVQACAPGKIRALLETHDYVFFRWSTVAGRRACLLNHAKMETFRVVGKSHITPIRSVFSQLQLIATYYLLTSWFNGSRDVSKRVLLFLGGLFPAFNVDAYFLAYAVPGVVACHVESEWALPIKNTQKAVEWISKNAIDMFGGNTFEIHVRFVPADDAVLSPAHKRKQAKEVVTDFVYIDINIPVTMGYSLDPFYRAMQKLDGKPHWSKLHDLRASEIRELYDLSRFDALREQHDPDNLFGRAPYITKVLGPHPRERAKAAANWHANLHVSAAY